MEGPRAWLGAARVLLDSRNLKSENACPLGLIHQPTFLAQVLTRPCKKWPTAPVLHHGHGRARKGCVGCAGLRVGVGPSGLPTWRGGLLWAARSAAARPGSLSGGPAWLRAALGTSDPCCCGAPGYCPACRTLLEAARCTAPASASAPAEDRSPRERVPCATGAWSPGPDPSAGGTAERGSAMCCAQTLGVIASTDTHSTLPYQGC